LPGCGLLLQAIELAQSHSSTHESEPIDEQDPVEVIYLVLQ